MRDEAEKPFSLKKYPEIAQEIGFLTMVTANLDCWMMPAVATMLRGKHEVAEAIMTRVESVSTKFEIMVDIARHRDGTPLANSILEVQKPARDAIQFRNKVAHGLYGFESGGALCLVPFPLSKKRGKPKPIAIRSDLVRTHTDHLGRLIEAIATHVGQSYFASEFRANP